MGLRELLRRLIVRLAGTGRTAAPVQELADYAGGLRDRLGWHAAHPEAAEDFRREAIRVDGEALSTVEGWLRRVLPRGVRLRYAIGVQAGGRGEIVRVLSRRGMRSRPTPYGGWGAGGAVCYANPVVLRNLAAALRAASYLPEAVEPVERIVETVEAWRTLYLERIAGANDRTGTPQPMNTLILSGFGLNCERETAYACRRAGAEAVHVRHINEIYTGELRLEDYGFLVLIGGFLDGDDLGAARAGANRFRFRRMPGGGTFLDELHRFIDAGRLVLGICNGFQMIVKLGLLPGEEGDDGKQRLTLTTNADGRFEDRWVDLQVDPASPCVFTRGLERIELPVRHGEGRLIGADDALPAALVESRLVPLRYSLPDGTPTEQYPANPNGSPHGIAAVCNPRGTVLGMMPHPEAFNHYTNHPRWTRRPRNGEDGDGLAIFRNAYAYLRERGA